MKKWITGLLALAMLLSLAACGPFVPIMPGTELETAPEDPGSEDGFREESLFSFTNRTRFGENYYADTPVALSYQTEAEDGAIACRSYVFDRASIIAACDALRDVTLTGRSDEAPVSGAKYVLTMADGQEYDFTFGLLSDGVTRVFNTYSGNYTFTGGDALWGLTFPAYDPSYDVFDLYFSDDVRAFADNFYQNTPVSVGIRLGSGATITSTDPAAVEAAFRALSDMSVIVVENQPDQNIDLTQVRDYIFTMADGSYTTFSFVQRCLSVTANAGFGPVYYWLTGVDELWNVEIASENRNGKFEGGPVAGLREDIARAADTVENEDSELSVLGVFVEYAIGEETGYLTLDGDTADSFVRQMCEVNATAETTDAPTGDKITVSVTLSDSSGPILYFTGDTIQQVVGIHYLCDSGDMQALRDRVLELAAGGNNTAAIEDGGTE